ncbi:hypothetical protein JCM11641_002630 [Rhodosporidiobolus odoratus]
MLTNSVACHARALQLFEEQAQRRRAAFQAEEARLKREMDKAMSVVDEKSEAGRRNPRLEGSAEAEAEAMQRCLADPRRKAQVLERMIAHQGGQLVVEASPSSNSSQRRTLSPLASFGVMVKVKESKPWTSKFDMDKREGWIKTAAPNFAGLQLDVYAVLDEHLTLFPFSTIRSLFSPDATNGSILPQAWFDVRNGRVPFTLVQAVFEALRLHWADGTDNSDSSLDSEQR